MNGTSMGLSQWKGHIGSLIPSLAEKVCSSNPDLSVVYQGCKYVQEMCGTSMPTPYLPGEFFEHACLAVIYSPQAQALGQSLIRAIVDDRTVTYRVIEQAWTAAHHVIGRLS